MEGRETKKVITPVGKIEVEMYSYFTGGEKMKITALSGEKEYAEWLLKTLVVKPSYESIMDMHGKDFDFLLSEAFEVARDSTWEGKKKQSSDSTGT